MELGDRREVVGAAGAVPVALTFCQRLCGASRGLLRDASVLPALESARCFLDDRWRPGGDASVLPSGFCAGADGLEGAPVKYGTPQTPTDDAALRLLGIKTH